MDKIKIALPPKEVKDDRAWFIQGGEAPSFGPVRSAKPAK